MNKKLMFKTMDRFPGQELTKVGVTLKAYHITHCMVVGSSDGPSAEPDYGAEDADPEGEVVLYESETQHIITPGMMHSVLFLERI